MKMFAATLVFAALTLAQDLTEEARGRAEFAAGRIRSAKSWFERSVRSLEGRPRDQSVALASLGQTLIALGERSAAERFLLQAADLNPESAQAWQLLGQAMLLKGALREAETALRKAEALAPTESAVAASCQSDLATLYMATKREREAAEVLERAIALATPGQARARMLSNLGSLRWRAGRREESAELLGRALAEMESAAGRQHPDVGRVLEAYSVVLAKLGRKTESRAMADRARELKSIFGWQANGGAAAVDWRDLR